MTWCFKTSIQLPKGQLNFVEKWPLSNPNDLVFIFATYLVFIFKIGPYVMENRGPFQIKPVVIAYNGFKFVNSVMLTYQLFCYIMDKGLYITNYGYDDVTIYRIAMLYWKYLVTMILDLFDSVLLVLQKKERHITFFHVYHHVVMVVISWSCLKYDPSDLWALSAAVNCGTHSVLHAYYGLSAMGLKYSKYMWWKKYITMMQLIQFVLVSIHLVIQACISPCLKRSGTYWVGLSNMSLFLILFTQFYSKRHSTKVGFAHSIHLQ